MLDSHLKNIGIKYLLLTGVFAQACVRATASSAIDLGYKIITGENLISYGVTNVLYTSIWYKENGTWIDNPLPILLV